MHSSQNLLIWPCKTEAEENADCAANYIAPSPLELRQC